METQKYAQQSATRTDNYSETASETGVVERYPTIVQPRELPVTRPHSCHCGPTAPCRISGKCTCMAGLLKKIEEGKKE